MITRRQLIRSAGLGVLGFPIVLTGCGVAVSPANPVVNAGAGAVARRLGQVALDFVLGVGASLVATEVDEFLEDRNANEQKKLESANLALEQAGFTDFRTAPVYMLNSYCFYWAYSNNTANGAFTCMPCLPLGEWTAQAGQMFEGPSLVILQKLVQHYSEQMGAKGVATAEAILPHPREPLQTPATQRFRDNFEFAFNTGFGWVTVQHWFVNENEGVIQGEYKGVIADNRNSVELTVPGGYSLNLESGDMNHL
jgi:hypothetical protein